MLLLRAAVCVARYRTLLGDQTLRPAPAASTSGSGPVALKTLLPGADVHLFNNSETLQNPFLSAPAAAAVATNRTGLNLNQAEVRRCSVLCMCHSHCLRGQGAKRRGSGVY